MWLQRSHLSSTMTFNTNTDIDIDLVHYLGPIFWGKFSLTPLLEASTYTFNLGVVIGTV